MNVFPAIDLMNGKAVRLHKGQRDQVTVYHDNPPVLAGMFAEAGASRIHVVDLDGAFSGARAHREVVEEITARSPVPIQVGGGIRDRAALEAVIAAGASFAVLGTAAVRNPEFAARACADFPGKIIIAVDARDGVVAVEGWVASAPIRAEELGLRAALWGAAGLLYTDIARDGTGEGPNVAVTASLAAKVGIPVIASGGVSTLDHIRALRDAGIEAVVVGRALYDGNFTLAEAIAASAS